MYSEQELLQLCPVHFQHLLPEHEILDFFNSCRAVWFHNGDVKNPHAQLSTGLCTNAYFDCPAVLKFPRICEVMAFQLYLRLYDRGLDRPDWVIGSPYSSITLSYEMAKVFRARHGFTQKDPADPTGKKMIWKGGPIGPYEKILQVEELITEGDTLGRVRHALTLAQPKAVFLPMVATLVHRPAKLPVWHRFDLVSLIERQVWAVPQTECHLCKAGSPRLPPRGNLAALRLEK